MTRAAHDAQLSVTVLASSDVVAAEIRDARPVAVSIFGELSERWRDQLAHDAWSIGLRALAIAHAQAQEARLQDVGAALLDDIDRQLKTHVEAQQQTIATILGRFFDPNDGHPGSLVAIDIGDRRDGMRIIGEWPRKLD